MTHQELKDLLTLAAQAGGVPTTHWNDGDEPYSSGPGFARNGKLWNAWHSSADALALAAAFRMSIEINESSIIVSWADAYSETFEVYTYPDTTQNEDYEIVFTNHEAAVRRAIVRMAAKIQKEGLK